MDKTLIIQVINQKALKLLHELEELDLIKVMGENITLPPTKLSEKYKGVFSKDDAISFNIHTQQMRKEWDNI